MLLISAWLQCFDIPDIAKKALHLPSLIPRPVFAPLPAVSRLRPIKREPEPLTPAAPADLPAQHLLHDVLMEDRVVVLQVLSLLIVQKPVRVQRVEEIRDRAVQDLLPREVEVLDLFDFVVPGCVQVKRAV